MVRSCWRLLRVLVVQWAIRQSGGRCLSRLVLARMLYIICSKMRIRLWSSGCGIVEKVKGGSKAASWRVCVLALSFFASYWRVFFLFSVNTKMKMGGGDNFPCGVFVFFFFCLFSFG